MTTARPKQITTDEMLSSLFVAIRGQFCGDLDDKEWHQHKAFIRVNVLLWPARFMAGKGFTVSEARYDQIMRAILSDIKAHATTAPVRYWPGYLMKCVQDHWKHHWEEYYEEAKSVRLLAETTVVQTGKIAPQERGVEALAMAHKVLTGSRRNGRIAKVGKQLSLLDL